MPNASAGRCRGCLLIAALGGAGAFYARVHWPLTREGSRKDATIAEKEASLADLTRQLAEARHEADAARVARADLATAQSELDQARAYLARTAAQREGDEKLLAQLRQQAAGGGAEVAEVKGEEGRITVTMVDRILFQSGVADLTPQGQELLRKLGGVFQGTDKLIEVCGHADNQPVESALKELYPTNWELSTARATNVVRFLQEQVGIKPRRLKAAGFGASRPVASNAKAAGRARNRRIEILLLPDHLKVVKGDFSDEIAAAKPATDKGAQVRASTRRPTDRERARTVVAARGRQSVKQRPK